MLKVFAFCNQKGGVGKTTTAVNLAACLARNGKKVLLIDADPQGNATQGLGILAGKPHLYHVLSEESDAGEAVRVTDFAGLSLLPADRELIGVEVEFVGQEGWEYRLRLALRDLSNDFDVILLDCPPSLGHLTVNALTAADRLLVPLQCEYYALEGISELVAKRSRANPSRPRDRRSTAVFLPTAALSPMLAWGPRVQKCSPEGFPMAKRASKYRPKVEWRRVGVLKVTNSSTRTGKTSWWCR